MFRSVGEVGLRVSYRMRWIGVVALITGPVVLSSACGSEPTGAMVSIPPPAGWTEDVRAFRVDKDRLFREAQDSPLRPEDRGEFGGLDYWEPDARYYFVGPLHPYVERARFEIVATSGVKRPCEKLGWIAFPLDGSLRRLEVYRLLDGDGGPFLPFLDATSGAETYPAGRYVDLRGPEGGPYVLDFNMAYNPSCAYGAPERYACPVTPAENRLAVRIEAGERGYKEPGAADGRGT